MYATLCLAQMETGLSLPPSATAPSGPTIVAKNIIAKVCSCSLVTLTPTLVQKCDMTDGFADGFGIPIAGGIMLDTPFMDYIYEVSHTCAGTCRCSSSASGWRTFKSKLVKQKLW